MWDWISSYHDNLQALGPVATIFAALMAVTVTVILGIAQWRISRAQKDIAFERFLAVRSG